MISFSQVHKLFPEVPLFATQPDEELYSVFNKSIVKSANSEYGDNLSDETVLEFWNQYRYTRTSHSADSDSEQDGDSTQLRFSYDPELPQIDAERLRPFARLKIRKLVLNSNPALFKHFASFLQPTVSSLCLNFPSNK